MENSVFSTDLSPAASRDHWGQEFLVTFLPNDQNGKGFLAIHVVASEATAEVKFYNRHLPQEEILMVPRRSSRHVKFERDLSLEYSSYAAESVQGKVVEPIIFLDWIRLFYS